MSAKLLNVLKGSSEKTPPLWFMRQAGRHLPEYLETRAKAKDFIDFCFSPDLASEATLQPIRRYDVDGAILFADILLIPIALGRSVTFVKGTGPVLEPITTEGIKTLTLEGSAKRLSSIYQTVSQVRSKLDVSKTLIGFCGGPWTVATYMIEGKGSPNKEIAKRFGYEHPEAMDELLAALADSSAEYLLGQIKAGADVVKIFESWAEGLSPYQFERFVVKPTKRLVARLRDLGGDVPIIGFPRGAGLNIKSYVDAIPVNAMACGTDTSIAQLRRFLPKDMPVQGNLDPLLLRMGGEQLLDGVDRVLEDAKGGPHIFNLGHGVAPDVSISDMHAVINRVRRN